MKKYEYKVIAVATGLAMSTKQFDKEAQELEAKLNELGADGWELVQRKDGFFFLERLSKFFCLLGCLYESNRGKFLPLLVAWGVFFYRK